MFHIKVSLFARTKSLENKIDLFHDKIIDAAMTFKKAIRVFLNEKRSENYRKLSKQIKTIEHDADALRRDIENKLYIQNLIPDLRADVLHLVENLDKIINKFDEVTYNSTLSSRTSLPNTIRGSSNSANRFPTAPKTWPLPPVPFSATSAPSATIRKKFTSSNMNPI